LVRRGARVSAFDPVATAEGVVQLATAGVDVEAAPSAEAACAGADAIVAATEWPEFRQLDWTTIAGTMPGRKACSGNERLATPQFRPYP